MPKQPVPQRVLAIDASADQVERQENDILPMLYFGREGAVVGHVESGRIHVADEDVRVNGAQSMYCLHNSATRAGHHRDESPPAAPEGRPPAKSSAIPGGNSRLVQRRASEDAAAITLGDLCRIVRHQTRKIGMQI